jgi:hypothetical protein
VEVHILEKRADSDVLKMGKSQHSLVGGFNPSEKHESQWEGLSHILLENKKCLKPPTSSVWITIFKGK